MLLNYLFAVPGFVYSNALAGTGDTRTAFIFQVTTIIVYLIYLYVLSYCFTTPLAVYLTAEYLFVALLGIQSYIYLKKKQIYNLPVTLKTKDYDNKTSKCQKTRVQGSFLRRAGYRREINGYQDEL